MSETGPAPADENHSQPETGSDGRGCVSRLSAYAAPPSAKKAVWQVAPRIVPEAPAPASEFLSCYPGYSKVALRKDEVPWWNAMPKPNQVAAGLLCLIPIGWAMTVCGPPAYSSVRGIVQAATFPYTPAGRLQTCNQNMKAIYQAVSLYTADNDGHFPPLEYQGNGGERITWVGLLQSRSGTRIFHCPAAPGISRSQSRIYGSYVMNPVLAGNARTAVDRPEAPLLFAEGGEKHDISLLPPLPTWSLSGPDAADSKANGAARSKPTPIFNAPVLDAAALNVEFRHDGQAGLIYADGHLDMVVSGFRLADLMTWGGNAALRAALRRVSGRGSVETEFVHNLEIGNAEAAASLLKSNPKQIQAASEDINRIGQLMSYDSPAADISRITETLERAAEIANINASSRESEAEVAKQCAAALRELQSASWELRNADPDMTVQVPGHWRTEVVREGKFVRTYFRSAVKDLYIMIEISDRDPDVPPFPTDWTGADTRFHRLYGSRYKRISMSEAAFGIPANASGIRANAWEYELRKPGHNWVRYLEYGSSGSENTYHGVGVVPSVAADSFLPVFKQILENAQFHA